MFKSSQLQLSNNFKTSIATRVLSQLGFLLPRQYSMTKKQVGVERVIDLHLHIVVYYWRKSGQAGTWRQGLMQRPWWSSAYWLAPHDIVSLLSYRNQDHQSRDGIIHDGLALVHQSLMPYRPAYDPSEKWKHFFFRFPPLRSFYLVSSWHKSVQHRSISGILTPVIWLND